MARILLIGLSLAFLPAAWGQAMDMHRGEAPTVHHFSGSIVAVEAPAILVGPRSMDMDSLLATRPAKVAQVAADGPGTGNAPARTMVAVTANAVPFTPGIIDRTAPKQMEEIPGNGQSQAREVQHVVVGARRMTPEDDH